MLSTRAGHSMVSCSPNFLTVMNCFCCKKKHLWWGVKAMLICGYKDRCLEITWQHSRLFSGSHGLTIHGQLTRSYDALIYKVQPQEPCNRAIQEMFWNILSMLMILCWAIPTGILGCIVECGLCVECSWLWVREKGEACHFVLVRQQSGVFFSLPPSLLPLFPPSSFLSFFPPGSCLMAHAELNPGTLLPQIPQ